jgi:hypothetical protein
MNTNWHELFNRGLTQIDTVLRRFGGKKTKFRQTNGRQACYTKRRANTPQAGKSWAILGVLFSVQRLADRKRKKSEKRLCKYRKRGKIRHRRDKFAEQLRRGCILGLLVFQRNIYYGFG